MALEALKHLGYGGAGLESVLGKALVELQGLSFAVAPGVAAGQTIAVPAIRREDTVLLALAIADAGGATDHTAAVTINHTRARGTLTLGNVVNGNVANVNGLTYTFRTNPVAELDLPIAGTPALNAAALAAKINSIEGGRGEGAQVRASAAAAVVTIVAQAEGAAGNSVALSGSANVTASGATLAGGTASGGLVSTINSTASKVVVVYFNKK